MVAEIQRFEDAARIAMGDYSDLAVPAPVRGTLVGGVTLTVARAAALLGRAVGKPTA